MASITFVDYETIIPAAWLNEVNLAVFGLMGDGTNAPTTIADAATNLGVLQVINDLSDLNDPAAARTNLGVDAAGADTAYNFRANNLSDVADAALARGNIGAGTPGFGDATSLAAIVPVNGADNENTHSTPLFVSVVITLTVGDSPAFLDVGPDAINYVSVVVEANNAATTVTRTLQAIVPPGYFWRLRYGGIIQGGAELY